MNIKKGDTVKIVKGKDKGKTGKVVKTSPKKDLIAVEGLNLYKKHVKPKREGEKGEIVQIARPIERSNLALTCPSCSKPTRIGSKMEDGKKVRVCKKCKASFQ